MKKLLLLALAALTVSAAQAVTWTAYNASSATSIDISSIGGASSSISVVYTFTYDGTTAININNLLFSVIRNSSYTSATDVSLSTNGSTYYRLWTTSDASSKSYYTKRATLSLSAGTNIVALVIDRDSIDGARFNIYVNDSEFLESSTSLRFTRDDYENAVYSTLTTYDVSGISNGTIYVAQGVATAAEIAVLPEPTVLALLALGVAGLALKRRVA